MMETKSPAHVALGCAIRARRRRLRLTLPEAGERCGLHRNYLGGLERGEINPTYTNLIAVAGGLNLRPSWLLRLAEQHEAAAKSSR